MTTDNLQSTDESRENLKEKNSVTVIELYEKRIYDDFQRLNRFVATHLRDIFASKEVTETMRMLLQSLLNSISYLFELNRSLSEMNRKQSEKIEKLKERERQLVSLQITMSKLKKLVK